MSIANAFITPSRGYLMTDSLVTWHDYASDSYTPLGFGTKLVVLPHINCAATFIGTTRFAAAITMALNKAVLPNGLDSVCMDGQRIFSEVSRSLDDEHPEHASDGIVVLVGWSDHLGHMSGLLLRNDLPTEEGWNDFTPYDLLLGKGACFPSFGVLHDMQPTRKEAPEVFLKRVSLEQQRLFDERDDPWGCGGDMILAEVTRHRIEVRKVGEFPDKAHAATLMKQAA